MKVENAAPKQFVAGPTLGAELQLAVGPEDLAPFEATAEAEHLRRLEADLALVLVLSAEGLDGPTWHRLSRALVEYGLAVMRAWISSGLIYVKLSQRGIALASPTSVGLTATEEDVLDLASDTVTNAVRNFRRVLASARWDPGRGATLATFFVGNCLLQFPNVLRTWKRERPSGVLVALDTPGLRLHSSLSAEAEFIERSDLFQLIARLSMVPRKPLDKEVLNLLLAGYTVPEISELTGLRHRQVSSRIYRIRKLLKLRGHSR